MSLLQDSNIDFKKKIEQDLDEISFILKTYGNNPEKLKTVIAEFFENNYT